MTYVDYTLQNGLYYESYMSELITDVPPLIHCDPPNRVLTAFIYTPKEVEVIISSFKLACFGKQPICLHFKLLISLVENRVQLFSWQDQSNLVLQ